MPFAGYRNYTYDISVGEQGQNGYYWLSSPNGSSASQLYVNKDALRPSESEVRAFGQSVRCFKNDELLPVEQINAVLTYSPDGPTIITGSVQATLTSEMTIDVLSSGRTRANATTFTKIYTDNISEPVNFVNAYGIGQTLTVEIDWLDNTAPTCEVDYFPSILTS